MQANRKDLASGGFFAAVGVLYAATTIRTLDIGAATEMGPGYMPLVLSGALVVTGAVLGFRGLSRGPSAPFGVVPWRGLFTLLAATLIFAAFFEELGMFPGIFVTSFLAALASPKLGILKALVMGLAIAAFCTALFGYALNLPAPIVGPLFGV